ncbi:hypothetical protein EVAR_10734_1 [Eumeta japonica]|uniref:Uncharacterized protein n=1 Tax=Eumeta variegata TaxID=151549 RepID=A0A4C1W9G5_EUMVA|nr:hypothetical protein EVAR_10734_1 [Eumeta japonica]
MGVSTDVEECTSGTKKLLMELGINKLGKPEILYVIEIEDTEHDIYVTGIKPRCAISGFYDSTSGTHQVITFLMSTFLLMKTCRVLLGLSVSHHQQKRFGS